MKAIIYSRVSSKGQSTKRQVSELKKVQGFEIQQVFREKLSAFKNKAIERPELQNAIDYMIQHDIGCMMIHEVSRLGRNTADLLNLIEELKNQGICLYIHNLGIKINTENPSEEIFTKLIVTLMADLARMESEQMSYRIKSGIRVRKEKGLHTGRKVGSFENTEAFLNKHKDIQKFLKQGFSYRQIQKLCSCGPNTIQKVKNLMEIHSLPYANPSERHQLKHL